MLITCPECNHEISDTAASCPNCGYIFKKDVAKKRTRNGRAMKQPNGFGSVYKLSGTRRKPYRAIVTKGWTIDENGKSKQRRETIGYYETKTEALQALADFSRSPYDVNASKVTFAEVFEKWSSEHFPTVSESNAKGYRAAYLLCEPIKNKRMADVKLDDLQYIADNSGKNMPTLRKFKNLVGLMFKYAVIHDIVTPDMNKTTYIDIKKAGNPNKRDRTPFSPSELARLWAVKDANVYFTVVLMLIYTGVRVSELLDLKKENVNLSEQWFDVVASKTQAGVRKVPIADKVLPFFDYWYNLNDCDYLLSTNEGEHFLYRNYYDSYWSPLMEQLNMNHKPHDTRHTCVSLLAEAGVDDRQIKKIVGHKGIGVTEIVYTHFEIQSLLDAINKI